jgi:hypothetical protein
MRTGKFAVLAGVAALLLTQGVARAGDIAKCEDAVAKGSRNVGNQEQKKNRKCIKDGSGTVTSCVDTESAKAVVKGDKLDDLYATGGKCDGVVAQVNSDPNDIEADTVDASGDISRSVWGSAGETDGVVAGDKCSDKIAKRAGKKFDTELKAFRACVKDNAPLAGVAGANACVTAGVNDAKAQSTVQPKLDADVAAQCGAFPPSGTEDGFCGGAGTAAAFSACVGNIVDCEACLAMNNSNGGTADCDLLDDGNTSNNSCPPVVGPPPCPLASGIYTSTQVAGGALTVDSLSPFPFPAGGTIVQHVSGATQPTCVHTTVVPYPGGFSAPVFCIPGFNFSVKVEQTGCGVGRIDSNGGSDFTITETGDTSSPTVCSLPASNCLTPPGDSNVQVNVKVGNGSADVCGSGTANLAVSVPVFTTTWTHTPASPCPDPDGLPGGMGDATVVAFPQILDFTSDTTSADWLDLDPDGCCLAGSGPSSTEACAFGGGSGGGLSDTGTCADLTGINIAGADATTVASGTVGSNGAPLYDLTFSTSLPNELTGPSGAASATCASPPVINFAGTVTRCIP